jgi:hypothetical protein
MTTYEITIPQALRASVSDDTPQAITEFLAEREIIAGGVSIRMNPAGEPETLIIAANVDPRAALAGFTPGHTSEQTARLREGIGLLNQYATAVESGVTPSAANTAQAVRIMYRVLEVLLGGDPRIRDLLDGPG